MTDEQSKLSPQALRYFAAQRAAIAKRNAPFDPFMATWEDANGLAALKGRHIMQMWVNAQILTTRRDLYIQKPIDGVALCAQVGLVMPTWLADAYLSCHRKIAEAETASLDVAFGNTLPKGVHEKTVLDAKKFQMQLCVQFSVGAYKKTTAGFNQAGKDFGMSGKAVQALLKPLAKTYTKGHKPYTENAEVTAPLVDLMRVFTRQSESSS